MLNKRKTTGTAAFLVALMFMLSFTFCKKKDSDPTPASQKLDVQVDKTTAERGSPGYPDTIKVNVLTELGWSLETDQPWLVPASRTGSGNAVIKVSAAYNEGSAARTGTITVTTIGGAYTKTISITQEGARLYLVPSTTDTIRRDGQAIQVQVFAPGPWHLELWPDGMFSPDPNQYVTVSQSSGTGNANVTLTFHKSDQNVRLGYMSLVNNEDPSFSVPFAQQAAIPAGMQTSVALCVNSASCGAYYSTSEKLNFTATEAFLQPAAIDLTVARVGSPARMMLMSYAFRGDPASGLTETVPAAAPTSYYRRISTDGFNFPTFQGGDYFLARSVVDTISVNATNGQQSIELNQYDVIEFRNQAGKKGFIKVEGVSDETAGLTIWTE